MCWVKAPVSVYCSERQSIMKKLLLHFHWCITETPAHSYSQTGVLGCAEGHKGILEHSSNVKDACCVFIHSVKPVKKQWKHKTVYTHNIFSYSIFSDGDKLVFVRNPPPLLSDTESVKSKRRVTKEEGASIERAPRALQWRS